MQPTHPALRGQDVEQDSGIRSVPVAVVGNDPVLVEEAKFVLAAFEELKSMRDAELKITVSVDRESGQPEIIYCGVQKKRSIDVLRRVYRIRRDKSRG
jgi:hypothetical protein